jgi:uncharacterized protein YqiB (DUF1249 family)
VAGLSHTLEQTRNKQPMWVFENNYIYLRELFPEIIELGSEKRIYRDSMKLVKVSCMEISRYTTLILLELTFKTCPKIPPVEMRIRLYHDAQLADVISYQDITRLIAPYFSDKMYNKENHKRQANLLLNELLMGCVKHQKSVSA